MDDLKLQKCIKEVEEMDRRFIHRVYKPLHHLTSLMLNIDRVSHDPIYRKILMRSFEGTRDMAILLLEGMGDHEEARKFIDIIKSYDQLFPEDFPENEDDNGRP